MSAVRRFRGTLLAALLLFALVGGWLISEQLQPEAPTYEEAPALFDFEKEDMVGVRVERPDVTIELAYEGGEWTVVGQPWRPSRSMVRRVAHQIHDLTARATVASVEQAEEVSTYGLGEDAIRVSLTLKDGSTVQFEAGDPNPTSVSYYIRPLPDGDVYVVKKAAVDYYRLPLEEFRERRFAWLDADDADTIDATVDGRTLSLQRVGPKQWRMTEPVEQPAARDEVRTMLGRTGALKAFDFLADQPDERTLARYGLEPARHRVRIGMSSGDPITVRIGDPVPGSDPSQSYAYREEDDAIYATRDGFLDAFQLPIEQYRRRRIVGRYEWDVQELRLRRGEDLVELYRTSDGWRWADGTPVPGSTPKRLASRVADARALAFHDEPVPGAGLQPPWATVSLVFEDGERSVFVGAEREVPVEGQPYPETRRYLRVDGDPVIYEVDGSVGSVIEDAVREHGRKLERDSEKRIRAAAGSEDAEEEP